MANATPGSDGLYGVYWVGTNGHIYFNPNGGGGVLDEGKGQAGNNMFSTPGAAGGTNNVIKARQVADPNAPKAPAGPAAPDAPANPNGTGGSGGSATTYADKSNDISQQNAALGAVDTQTNSGISQITSQLAKILAGYDAEAGAAKTNYTTQSNTNQNNRQTNQQTSLVNAAAGRKGLFGSLSSIGALNGSGIELANEAVRKGANEDLATGQNTFSSNQTTLDNGFGTFTADDKRRRDDANTAAEQSKQVVQNTGLKNRQSAYQNLANDYAAEGNAGQAKNYTDMANTLFPQIASTSVPVTTNLAPEAATYTPGSLGTYLSGGVNATHVASTPGGTASGIPGLFASTDRKKVAA